MITEQINEHQQIVEALSDQCVPCIERIVKIYKDTISSGHKIWLCGNSESAAEADNSQYIIVEFVGCFLDIEKLAYNCSDNGYF